jgi:hypothetical protein
LTPSQLIGFEEHIVSLFDLVSSLPSSLDFPIDVEPRSTKQKLDFDVHKPNTKIAKL